MKRKPHGAGPAAEDKLTRGCVRNGDSQAPPPTGSAPNLGLFNQSPHVTLRFGHAPGTAPPEVTPQPKSTNTWGSQVAFCSPSDVVYLVPGGVPSGLIKTQPV